MQKQYIKMVVPSGNNFCWKDFPNIVVSKFPIAVNTHINNKDPIYPPNMVYSCDDASKDL